MQLGGLQKNAGNDGLFISPFQGDLAYCIISLYHYQVKYRRFNPNELNCKDLAFILAFFG